MALAAGVQWDVRTTGNDTNGGGFDPTVTSPGTDYSQQNSAQIAYTDLVIGATNTQLTSAGNPFTSAHVGNVINITGGTGFTTGRYEILSVSGSTATMDRAVGTASSTGGTGNLGGAMATIQAAVTAASASNTVNIKSGTYTFTSTMTISQISLSLIGFNSTHGDGGTKPLITTSTNSTVLINTSSSGGGAWVFSNLLLSNTASTRASGIWQQSPHGTGQHWVIVGCIFDGFTAAVDCSDGTPDDVQWIHLASTEIKNCTTVGLVIGGNTMAYCLIVGCFFYSNVQHISAGGSVGPITILKSVFANSTGASACVSVDIVPIIDQCTFANNNVGVQFSGTTTNYWSITNTIFYGTTGQALNDTANGAYVLTAGKATALNNAFGSNGTNGNPGGPGEVTLTANPFTNASAGDYSLNSTAGGGAACKGAGYPGVFVGGLSTGHVDIGAVQSGSSGASGNVPPVVSLGMDGGIRG